MTHVVDAGGRWHWIDKEYEKIIVGEKFVIRDAGRWSRPTTYSKPMRVTRKTDLTFWLQGEDKEIRVARSSGKVHGSSYRYAKRLTDQLKKEIKAEKRRRKNEADKAAAEANAEETRMREKYGADKITYEPIQDVLRPIREYAETYHRKLEEIFDEIDGATAEEPQALVRYLEWNDDRASNIVKFQRLRDSFEQLHDQMIGMVKRWDKGVSYELKRPGAPVYTFDPANGPDEMVRMLDSKVGVTLEEQTSTYFNGHNEDDSWRYQFIYDLREIKEMRWDYARIDIVVEDE